MSAEPQQAAKEVLAGEPQAAARRWLGPTVLVMFVLFAIDTYFVVTRATLPFDIPVTTFIQQTNWGPLVYPLELINGIAGYLQVLVGVIAIVGLLVLERRACWHDGDRQHFKLDRLCLETCHLETAPPADLVHILMPATGYSYPSGHAVFFTWMSFMLAASLAPRLKPAYRVIACVLAIMVIVLTCLAMVWAGDHWPSDVPGGVLLGAGWSAFVLWLPERWLPSPSFRWFRRQFRLIRTADAAGDLQKRRME